MISPIGPVIADVLQKIGMNVEVQNMDLNTAFARRQSQAPVSEGGWSLFASNAGSAITANPVVDVIRRGRGLKGYPGNYDDSALESLIMEWASTTTEKDRFAITTTIQERLFKTMPIVPLGNVALQTAYRANLTGYLPNTTSVMWNIRRT
jgi:peptide/nickel transport system substrate-binding protein